MRIEFTIVRGAMQCFCLECSQLKTGVCETACLCTAIENATERIRIRSAPGPRRLRRFRFHNSVDPSHARAQVATARRRIGSLLVLQHWAFCFETINVALAT